MELTAPTRAADGNADGALSGETAGRLDRMSVETGMSRNALIAGAIIPIVSTIVIIGVLLVAPTTERSTIFLASLVAVAAGLSSTAVGVYGGVLVPGLLLLGLDARFVAALSLFLQVLVIPIAAGSHIRLGNFSKPRSFR